MEATILEPPEAQETANVEGSEVEKGPETAEVQKTEETSGAEGQPQETPEEPTVELDGEKIPLSQVKKLKEEYANDSKWQAKNTKRSEELARKEQELATLAKLLVPLVERTVPPVPQKDFNAELAALEQKRPDDPFSPEFKEWDRQRLQLVANIAKENAVQEFEQRFTVREAETNNSRIETDAYAKYSKMGVDEGEFVKMAQWIKENLQKGPKGYQANCFDIAYRELHQEEVMRNEKVKVTDNIRQSVLSAKPAKQETGAVKKTETPTPEEEYDAEFIRRVKERNGK